MRSREGEPHTGRRTHAEIRPVPSDGVAHGQAPLLGTVEAPGMVRRAVLAVETQLGLAA